MEMISSPRSSQESNKSQQQSSVFTGYAQQISGHHKPFGNNSGEKESLQQETSTGDLFHRSQVEKILKKVKKKFFGTPKWRSSLENL